MFVKHKPAWWKAALNKTIATVELFRNQLLETTRDIKRLFDVGVPSDGFIEGWHEWEELCR